MSATGGLHTRVLVGNRVRRAREEKDFTQLDVALKTGISLRRFQRIESGTSAMTISDLVKLSKALDLSICVVCPLSDEGSASDSDFC